ncbi:MAG TPA: Rrf2 family transcriptional regulator [Ktedonobacterales bacterium]|nr:Rrf2 family transcriptional regulator [Ktedonobacterales bacterium]
MSSQSSPSSTPTSTATTIATTLPSPQFGAQVNPNWFAAATQAVVYLARAEDTVCPSGAIADHMRSHAVFLRRVIATLCRAGLVEAREGRDGGYRLARPADQITLADIYRAIKATEPGASGCAPEGVSVRGPVLEPGVSVALDAVVAETEASMLDVLARHTVASFIAAADAAEGRHSLNDAPSTCNDSHS